MYSKNIQFIADDMPPKKEPKVIVSLLCPVYEMKTHVKEVGASPFTTTMLFCRKFYFRYKFEGFLNKKTPLITQVDNFNLTLIENH